MHNGSRESILHGNRGDTYQDMELLVTDKNLNWLDPGSFWSGDALPLNRVIGWVTNNGCQQLIDHHRLVNRHLPHRLIIWLMILDINFSTCSSSRIACVK